MAALARHFNERKLVKMMDAADEKVNEGRVWVGEAIDLPDGATVSDLCAMVAVAVRRYLEGAFGDRVYGHAEEVFDGELIFCALLYTETGDRVRRLYRTGWRIETGGPDRPVVMFTGDVVEVRREVRYVPVDEAEDGEPLAERAARVRAALTEGRGLDVEREAEAIARTAGFNPAAAEVAVALSRVRRGLPVDAPA